jgi:hypothetical protein
VSWAKYYIFTLNRLSLRAYLNNRQLSSPFSRLVSCSRWSEMTECLKFHIDLAAAAKAPTEFRLLNGNTVVVCS